MIIIKNLNKEFKHKKVLNNINMIINDNDIYGIIGLSGSGKTTLLRILSGVEKYEEGEIIINNENLLSKIKSNKYYDDIGVVFQGYNLLNQENIYDNISLPLKFRKIRKNEIDNKVKNLLKLINLEDKIYEYPSNLSGGQRQRVAIARALILNPKILLLDEITSALDPFNTKEVLDLILKIYKENKMTIVFISHQINSVKKICNKIMVLNEGSIIEQGFTNDVLNSNNKYIKVLVGGEVNEWFYQPIKRN